MILWFILLIPLVFTSLNISAETEKSKSLIYAQKIDAKNEKLGKSIAPLVKEDWIRHLFSNEEKNFMVFSGLEYLNLTIERKSITSNFRAYAEISYYPKEQIEEVREFIKKVLAENCKIKVFRESLFLFDFDVTYKIVDKVNKPFLEIIINRDYCREVEPYGRFNIISRREIKKIRKGPEINDR